MDIAELKKRFYQEVHPVHPNEWEVEEVLTHVASLSSSRQQALMSYVHVVWPISHSLCFSYLEQGAYFLRNPDSVDLAEWVRRLLGYYEKDGLRGAREFMSESLADTLAAGQTTVARLEDVRGRLLPFLRGLSGQPLDLAGSPVAWTDTATVYLPEEIRFFDNRVDNERFYVFLACCQWGYLTVGTFNRILDGQEPADIFRFLQSSDNQELAGAVYHFLEFSHVWKMLAYELPGLMRQMRPLLQRLVAEKSGDKAVGDQSSFARLLFELVHSPDIRSSPITTGRELELMYERLRVCHEREWGDWQFLTGKLDFTGVQAWLKQRRSEERKAAVKQLAQVIIQSAKLANNAAEQENFGSLEEGGSSRLVVHLADGEEGKPGLELRINNVTVDLPPELSELLARIEHDLGHIPEGYVQAAAGIAGRAIASGVGGGEVEEVVRQENAGMYYDEWDYRRRGYRKNWCTLIEKELHPVRSRFVESTLYSYRGMLVRLRRQFESLRTQHRFVRRRRYGDDIDLDALVDAVADRAAGIAPSDRLFVRLLRNNRDIAVMFLVDMSNSTEGWVGKAIKESLVLLGDVLEVVGDRFGIYGFSGMRRSRCELYRIKSLDEPYSELVQQRICAIIPKEYTRMATPVRHLTGLLAQTDARIRLLIVISDGKPEDYDDYKGEYAIEDTRQALIEARGKGVIPFCITVDREPHIYLPHMFGREHYIFVDSVEKLPRRMPEIYRLLTS
ncbi:nitric oxide reductase activation protein NorD [Desulfopila aestuarii]|uniref:Nitric oxide reductase NorD protein n=1 Tax=Desulfopila aestuarii DSM 18488 TaxID=1121416 RepID=A0A1M7YEK9_9BACT|nr:VWA domain-containing protein [Desulfopila aestuarii]SHO51043.1 nitric oxide reductase NorD protein [Desulfopila aestuarii DSM 18488]